MKRAAVAAFLFFVCASASADEWQTMDTVLLSSTLGLLAVDWAQTRELTRHSHYVNPACEDPGFRATAYGPSLCNDRTPTYHERNPLLPEHPSVGQVNRYFILAMAGTAGMSFAMPQRYRRFFLGTLLVIESVAILQNHQLGIRVSF